jgi:hypothetical protein
MPAAGADREDCRMPTGYLVTTSLVACGVLGALAPPRRPFILGVLSFVAGFALNELPFIAAAWLVVSTLLALDQTGLGSPVGVVAGAMAILATAGLLLVVRRALLAGPALERALALGLGAGWRGTSVTPGPGAGSRPAGRCSPRS